MSDTKLPPLPASAARRLIPGRKGEPEMLYTADQMREYAIAAQLAAPVAAQEPADPMDWPIPCDMVVGSGTIKKGCPLGVVQARMEVLHRMAMEKQFPGLAAPVAAQERSKSPMLDEFLQHAKDAGITALPITFDDAPPAPGARQPDDAALHKTARFLAALKAGPKDA